MTNSLRRVQRIVRTLLSVGIGLYLLALLVYVGLRLAFGDRFWPLSLINTFSLYLFIPLLITLPVLLITRRHRLSVIGVALLIILTLWYGPYYLPKASAAAVYPTLRVITFNMWAGNPHTVDVERWLAAQNADVILMQEGAGVYKRAGGIPGLRAQYPYQEVLMRDLPNITLSKFPILRSDAVLLSASRSSLEQRLVLDLNGQQVALYNVHLSVPLTEYPRSQRIPWPFSMVREFNDNPRNEQIALLVEHLRSEPLPYIVAGDFNTSSQSASYNTLAAVMQDSWRERGWGLGASWPVAEVAGFPAFVPPLIRIDYVWHSDRFRAISIAQGPKLGSDHLPLSAELELLPAG